MYSLKLSVPSPPVKSPSMTQSSSQFHLMHDRIAAAARKENMRTERVSFEQNKGRADRISGEQSDANTSKTAGRQAGA